MPDPYQRAWDRAAPERAARERARLEAEDAERLRNRLAWERFCGMLSPIGRLHD